MRTTRCFCTLALFLGFAIASIAAELRIGTLNCYLFFDPRLPHSGQVSKENPLSADQYEQKTANLASLLAGCDVIALQETGGREEVDHLASVAGFDWRWTAGRDTYTGEEVGLLFRAPWVASQPARVPAMAGLSKHLFVSLGHPDGSKVGVLVVHLIRPIGAQAAKHQAQLDAVREWARDWLSRHPNATLVVLGDTNHSQNVPGSSIYGFGAEAADLLGFQSTHRDNMVLDRIAIGGVGGFVSALVTPPPIPRRANKQLLALWTDHYFVSAVIRTR